MEIEILEAAGGWAVYVNGIWVAAFDSELAAYIAVKVGIDRWNDRRAK